MQPKFSVITVTYNRADLTTEILQKLAPQVIRKYGEWIFVDNASNDNTVKLLTQIARANFPNLELRIVSEKVNRGMGSGYNTGLKIARSDNVLMICNDVKVLGEIVEPTLDALNSAKGKETLFGPRLITFPTGWNSFKEIEIIPYVEGWYIAASRDMLLKYGGWDEQIFLDYEDLELSWRLHNAGIGLQQIQLPVMHMGGQSFTTLNQARMELTKISQKYFMEKWGFTSK